VTEFSIKGLEEFIEYAKRNPRGIIFIKDAIELVERIGFRAFIDTEDSDVCPYCLTEAEHIGRWRNERGFYIPAPCLRIHDGRASEKVPLCLPIVRDRALAPPVFSVGVNDLAVGLAKLLLGKRFRKIESPYLGVGKSAEFEALEAIRQIEANRAHVVAKYLKHFGGE